MLKHLRKYLPQAAFVLVVLGLGFAAAANITKSVQLSQDPSGPIGFDTQSSVYFPRHVNNSGTKPSFWGCGTSAITDGTDTAGLVQEGTGTVGGTAAASCGLTFQTAFASTPYCTANSNSPATPIGVTATPNGVILQHVANTQLTGPVPILNYHCFGGNSG